MIRCLGVFSYCLGYISVSFSQIGHDWGFYTIVSDLPKYSHDVLKFNIVTTGSLTALPFVAMWIFSFICGIFCDLFVKKGWHSIKTGRIIYTTIGNKIIYCWKLFLWGFMDWTRNMKLTFLAATGPAVCIILASYAGCNRNAAMVYFILSMGLMGGFYAGMKVRIIE